jgi:hypothetical protein
MYDKWYQDAHQRVSAQSNRTLAMPYYNRLRTNVLKLAVICEVSRSCSLQVSSDSMARAIGLADRLEAAIFDMLPTGMTQEGGEIDSGSQTNPGGGRWGSLPERPDESLSIH